MGDSPLTGVVQHLRHLATPPDLATLDDQQLVERFVSQRDESAFEILVRRHGPMVLGVCRRVLGNAADAEDAFQATLLVFASKARSIRHPERLGTWLYGVAFRTAQKARAAAARRRAKERQATIMPQFTAEPNRGELESLVDEELHRLPEKYRLPLILCDLEGRTRSDVARQLTCAEGTLSSRLARGRELLGKRLARRGLSVSAAALSLIYSQSANAAIPSVLLSETVQAGLKLAAGSSMTAIGLSAPVAGLTRGVLQSMVFSKVKIAAACLLALATAGTGVGMVALGGAGSAPLAGEARSDPAESVQSLIKQLGSDDFAVRQKADAELEKMGKAALPALREALKGDLDLETKTRVERLIGRIELALAQAEEKEAERKWGGKEGLGLRERLSRIYGPQRLAGIEFDHKVTDKQLAQALYLLIAGRAPKEEETAHVEKQLGKATSRRATLLTLGLELVKGRNARKELASVNRQMMDFQKTLGPTTAERMQALSGDRVNKLCHDVSAGLLKVNDGAAGLNDRDLVTTAYLLSLSRFPTGDETKVLCEHLKKSANRQAGVDNLLFALINSKEFVSFER
jgi:RNA polymerase sigma factor (sigma-70 family)